MLAVELDSAERPPEKARVLFISRGAVNVVKLFCRGARPRVGFQKAMRNLGVVSCTVLPAQELLGGAQRFCLDCDRGTVWVATGNGLCSIENNRVC